jgi:signal transduction histidine kinase
MMPARGRAWAAFVATAAVLVGVVVWLTVALLQLDRDEVNARRQASQHERLRLALWRMDSWLSPQIAREAMRAPAEYRSFPNAPSAWTRGLTKLPADAVVVPSPLLVNDSTLFSLHFEVGPNGVTSPQVPVGNERDLCDANGIAKAELDVAAERLRAFVAELRVDALETRLGSFEAAMPMFGCNYVSPGAPEQLQQSVNELSNRQRSVQANVWQQGSRRGTEVANPLLPGNEGAGPLVPVWIGGSAVAGGAERLLFVRRVAAANGSRIQGVVVDWPQLQRELTAQLADLFPTDSTQLVRCDAPTAGEQPSMLASVPARLVVACQETFASGLPLPWILGTTWGVTLLGLGVLWLTLRAAIGFGERRARFASAVTHELRTPLTTFRMYSEMLADGVVQDPQAQKEYLTTLQRESDRLSRVVENVLAWSRLEEGRFTARRVRLEAGPLLDRLVPTLQRRLVEANLQLVVRADDAARAAAVTTDEDAVGQVLFNLIDNAAKYARDAVDRRVELTATADGDRVTLAVRDHGPGVAAEHRHRIFAPFDRGAVAASSNEVPGVGLGLALARGLARDLGGDLVLVDAPDGGARFELRLPRG